MILKLKYYYLVINRDNLNEFLKLDNNTFYTST